ncbi:hypothetical protein E2C01_102222 [Portunus trituberculatus]|uniref:Uncharacterized protein n=1 Tax=Portunus trituberculatus TaxID=210409 RepID=A0A5B7KM32_PORTR|nr:hypothetical protein [Portunus trituberculatus]
MHRAGPAGNGLPSHTPFRRHTPEGSARGSSSLIPEPTRAKVLRCRRTIKRGCRKRRERCSRGSSSCSRCCSSSSSIVIVAVVVFVVREEEEQYKRTKG